MFGGGGGAALAAGEWFLLGNGIIPRGIGIYLFLEESKNIPENPWEPLLQGMHECCCQGVVSWHSVPNSAC